MGRLLPQDADAYDRRNRDVPPDKYLVPYCVRENEGNAQYSCPHLGCDGLGFHTARECHTHEDRYHAGPYRCGTCERLFATQSALERHCTETGHRIWVCRMSGCDMEGVCFGDGHEFEKHVRESRAHEGLKVDEALAGNDEDALSECSAVGKMCLAQACHKFEKFFASPAEWEKHAASRGHVRAISLFESFCQLDISADELAAKLEAARGLRCDKSDCRRFGAAMSSTQVFFHHLETEGHKDPEGLRAKEAEKRVRMVCEEPECARFGSEYRPAAFVKHVEGVHDAYSEDCVAP
ncbi:Zinc finger Y-chromosomal protein [Escovopsis weberi]|uniref:Zinc finger Y-chromosomal protein n=1 Tax=Escovopsis weberi TaxID=150374 RepID=A0A0M8N0M1_ESCWE|nr:Zinc finger Y-chromosomal protein [Escovopsis weberi]